MMILMTLPKPRCVNVADNVSGDGVLLDDLVQVEVFVEINSDDDNVDDEVTLDEVCQVNVVISPVTDVVVCGVANDDGTDCDCEG